MFRFIVVLGKTLADLPSRFADYAVDRRVIVGRPSNHRNPQRTLFERCAPALECGLHDIGKEMSAVLTDSERGTRYNTSQLRPNLGSLQFVCTRRHEAYLLQLKRI